MGTAELLEKYRCPSCHGSFDDEEDALACCGADMVYVCSVCGATSDFYHAALKGCDCEPPDPDDPPPRPTAAELEAMGQNRLF